MNRHTSRLQKLRSRRIKPCIGRTAVLWPEKVHILAYVTSLFLAIFLFSSCSAEEELRNGDIIFQTSQSSQSQAIQIATGSKYSHMGVIYFTKGQCYVYEAVQPVKITPLEEWAKRGEEGHYVVKRLKDANRLLTPDNLKRMLQFGKRYIGRDYDLYFEWSDRRMYCSEIVWKMYKQVLGVEVGQLARLRNFNLDDERVSRKLHERYGQKLPLDERVISPADMFHSDRLRTVVEK
ncbi:MAG: peptidoglycan peptidase [Bacteroidetes bacterium]|nr:MAG: peptidoglycan peptidase [Bacteroidota bacterium]